MEKCPMMLEEIEEDLPPHKRCKSSSSEATNNKRSVDSNECPVPSLCISLCIDQPGPLGLRLNKSQSFCELIQKRLSQHKKNNEASSSENLEVGRNKKKVQTSSPIDKLKATNFPAGSLRIGNWEYVSQREGDLVAKCYFAKHKLVWEVLDGGLKNKIEFQWSDIIGLKANCPDNGPGSLIVVLGKQPLFFRETNPQPRKHTIWQATSDFTDGNASTYRQHHLQCAQGVLNKHYEKLIQCDTRLNFLSQQSDPVSELPFAAEASIKPPNVSGNSLMPSTSQSSFLNTEEPGAVGLVCRDLNKEACLPNTDVSTCDIEEYVVWISSGVLGPKTIEQPESLGMQQTMSISDLVNHVGHCISEKEPSSILPSNEKVCGWDNQKDIVDDMSKILLSNSQSRPASDDPALMSRVDALCGLLQDCGTVETDAMKNNVNVCGSVETDAAKNNVNVLHDRNGSSKPDCSKMLEDVVKESEDEDHDHVSGYRKAMDLSGKDSYTEFVHQLPGITTLPRFLCDSLSDDGEF